MSRSRPASAAWAAFFQNHPKVIASWGETNGRTCNCTCAACMQSREETDADGWSPLPEGSIFD
jgi:hypothetical protein